MNKKFYTGSILLFLFSLHCSIYSQSSLNTSGGVATGNTGSVSYSIGQVFYLQTTGNDISIHEGVQIPYELFIITPVTTEHEKLSDLRVFPNPTSNYLILSTEYFFEESLTFYLFDINGRKVLNEKMLSSNTLIHMRSYLPGVYMLIVWNENTNSEMQKFKIIKTR